MKRSDNNMNSRLTSTDWGNNKIVGVNSDMRRSKPRLNGLGDLFRHVSEALYLLGLDLWLADAWVRSLNYGDLSSYFPLCPSHLK